MSIFKQVQKSVRDAYARVQSGAVKPVKWAREGACSHDVAHTPAITKVTFNMRIIDVERLKVLANKRNCTVTDVLHQALGTEFFLADNVKENHKVIIDTGDTLVRINRKW